MKNSDKQNARIESERALKKAVMNMMSDNMELLSSLTIIRHLKNGCPIWCLT